MYQKTYVYFHFHSQLNFLSGSTDNIWGKEFIRICQCFFLILRATFKVIVHMKQMKILSLSKKSFMIISQYLHIYRENFYCICIREHGYVGWFSRKGHHAIHLAFPSI